VNPEDLRAMLRRHVAGVAVVTTLTPDGAPIGLTVNSFTSVSLDPPLVSFCVANTASARPALERASRFAVTVLGADQAALASRFATSGVDRFAGVEWLEGTDGLPRLPGGLTWLSCVKEIEHPAGDHVIVIGRVHAAESGPADGPLLHHGGRLYGLQHYAA
jgi:3-hydroxy-9,10-secoandrosta-1,3,5(10)-triene-9,17-dione monooxygenase reductase component